MSAVGTVQVVLYAGLPGAAPTEVGTVQVPLTLKSASTGTIEGQLTEVLSYVAEDLKAVFGQDEPDEEIEA